ncbi:MAG: hypothetical protein ACXWCY_20600 [Burkholderiales bacterium]
MRAWNEFHADPRISYYLFLRRAQLCPASEAHAKLKRMDALVVGCLIQRPVWSGAARIASIIRFIRRSCSNLARHHRGRVFPDTSGIRA